MQHTFSFLSSRISLFSLLVLAALVFMRPAQGQDQNVAAEKPQEPIRAKTGPIQVNGIAAKVNGDVVTFNDLMIRVAPLQSVLMARFPRRGEVYESQLKELKDSVLDELIDRAIIYTEFKDRVKAFPDQDLEDEVARIVQNVYNGDEKLFRQYLQATNLTRDQFKEQQRKELLVQIVRSQHFGEVPPPKEPELRKEYAEWAKENRDRTKDVGTYRRIYLRKDMGGGPEAQLKLAEALMKRLAAGEDFATLAKEFSNDSKAEEGGLWDKIPRTDLQNEFGFLLFETKGNEVMGPIEDNYGFNIIQVIKRDFGPAKPFAEVRDEMDKRVVASKKKDNFEAWMKKMRARAAIQKMIR